MFSSKSIILYAENSGKIAQAHQGWDFGITSPAYQPGKSTETTLHHVITHTKEALENMMLRLELSKILRELLTAFPLTL